MAGIKIVNLPALGRNLASTDLFELSLAGGTGSRKITGQEILNTAKSGLVPTSRTLTINGTTQDLSADRTFTISTGITIGTTAITSGTVGRVLFEGTGNVVSESANLFFDVTNTRFGIGGTPTKTLSVIGSATSGFDAISFKGQYSETGYLATSNGAIYLASGAGVTGSFLELSSAVANLRGGTTAVTFTVSSERMRINNSGNVLINTTTDAGYKLDVNGTARVSSDATINTLTIGLGGSSVATNTSIGFATLQSNTSGSRQVAIGYGALQYNTSGTFNTAVGYRAMIGNSTGIRNVALGYQSLVQISTGNYNVGVGFETLFGISTQSNNTAIGYQALFNSASDNNTAIGYFAGNANTTGANNIFIGYNSAGALATESNRTWIGNATTATTWLGGSLLLGTTTNVASSIATLDSTTKGFLPPRMTTTQKNAIASPAEGLQVWDTTLKLMFVYNGTTWISL